MNGSSMFPGGMHFFILMIAFVGTIGFGVLSGILYYQSWSAVMSELEETDVETKRAYDKVDELIELAKESLNNE